MNYRFRLTAVLALLSALYVTPSRAAEASGPNDSTLDTITVTAERREANLQTVPITVAAVSAQALLNQGVQDTTGLVTSIPGLIFQQSGNYGTPFLRGVGATTGGPEVEPSVAFYVDGVYLQSESSILLNFNNIDRVEVLKGPQGTLFGRNASGGVIQVITKTPSQTPSADISIGYGNYNTVQTSFYGTTGITEHLAIDLALQGEDRLQGWGRNIATGEDTFLAYNGSGRSKVLWTPDDLTAITLAVDFSYSRGDEFNWILLPGAKNALGTAPYAGFFNPDNDAGGFTHSRDKGVSLHIDRDTPWGRLVSITADRFQQSWDRLDSDATPLPITAVNIFTQVGTFSQELQFLSPKSSTVNWIVGAYFLHDIAKLDPDNLYGSAIGGGPPNYVDLWGTATTKSYAGFAQATAPLGYDTNLTLGLRYTADNKGITGYTAFDGFPIPATEARQQRDFDKLTWRIALDHQLSADFMGYVSYNRGFKSGSFSVDSPAAAPVRPEVVDAYELGAKTQWLDQRLRINGSIFYYKFTDMQVQELDTATATEYFTNAASSKIYGLDLDFEQVVMQGLNVSGGLEFLHARYESFPNDPAYAPNSAGLDSLIVVDASGRQINSAPNFSGNLGVNYAYRLPRGKVDVNAHVSYTDGYPVNPDGRVREPSVTLLSSALSWTLPDERTYVRLWGANLTNKHYYSYASASATGDLYSPAAPRTFGIVLGSRF